ncbi:MAG: nitroreductase [Cyclobacteriaceae bacterium]
MKDDIAHVNYLMQSRRSVFPKDYIQGERVADEIIEKMLENANWAPTHKLTEPWRFVVFTKEGLHQLAEIQASCYKKVTTADGSFKEERYQNLLKKPLQSSHIILIIMKRDEKERVREVEEIGAVFCAIQNMYLTAASYGVGCYLSTGGVTYFEEAKKSFGLQKEDRIIGFFNVGVIREDFEVKSKRHSVKEKTKWINRLENE